MLRLEEKSGEVAFKVDDLISSGELIFAVSSMIAPCTILCGLTREQVTALRDHLNGVLEADPAHDND